MSDINDKKLGDVGTQFQFEDADVKVWDLVLEPGSPAIGITTRGAMCSS